MKKITLALLITSLGFTAALAQTKNNVEFGINTGYNAAYIFESGTNSHSDVVSGFNLGISLDDSFSDRWSIKVKVIYDQKGWGNGYITEYNPYLTGGFVGSGDVTYTNLNYKLNYLTIPIMANWHFGRARNWYLNFGPYAGFLLSANISNNKMLYDNNVKPYFNSTDFGLALGIGVKFRLSDKVKFFIEDDGQAGITNIFKSTDGSSVQSARSAINAGFSFAMR